MNSVTQNCEMDLVIRYWDNVQKRVQVRFWDSMCFGHGTHLDLLKHFSEGLEGLDMSKLTQISMDGLSVNWQFYEAVGKIREENELPKLKHW